MKLPEPGDRMDQEDEDRLAGRLASQKAIALRAKEVRSYITSHPGCGAREIRSGTGYKRVGRELRWLVIRGYITWKIPEGGYEVRPI